MRPKFAWSRTPGWDAATAGPRREVFGYRLRGSVNWKRFVSTCCGAWDMLSLSIEALNREIDGYELFQTAGKLRSANGLVSCTLPAAVGDQCEILGSQGRSMLAE